MFALSKPLYEVLYENIKNDINLGVYKEGDRVPSEKELSQQFEVSRITTKKALELLATEGLIIRQPGRGSFVKHTSTNEKESVEDDGKLSKKERTAPLIGLVITDFDDSYGTALISSIEKCTAKHSCFLVLRRTFGIVDIEQKAIRELVELGVEGLIIFPAQAEYFNEEILKLVLNKFPLVLVDRHLKGISTASVSTNNVEAARKGAEYLLDLGHRHIGLMTPPPNDTTPLEDRIEGFIQAHAENGVMVDRDLWINSLTSTLPNSFRPPNINQDIEKIKKHLLDHPSITALFAAEYYIALMAIEAVKELGMSVPEDVSIICFDSPPTHIGEFQLTYLAQDQEQMGQKVFEILMKLRNKGDDNVVPNRIVLDANLIIGNSTASLAVKK
ncbi:GntR family transcriptional regulator [Gracilibacillus kekensis]|uniref:DNA-binding transcriptional regulator, LacI/PurR family n=1 Tax=Gracilibacillus kekensis TaxID=1027249 RepID=A0A1M7LCC0_9BACI|nr:GntR family transcriptional regulator [Gracilibacillus kekensis]SHM75744.1 DNA-binding transcriptional regulator, LacI/PurR family [Gracilibacillus kekensis]